tara:strand:+ start:101 stop:847 length:747 start_codon:yes stop_codon:yes gene_type:complete
MKKRGAYTKGLISRCTKYKDSDIIFTLLSEEGGIQNFIARGAKKPSSKFSGHIEPINYVEIYYSGSSSLPAVSQVQSVNSFLKIKSDYNLLMKAQYLVELSEKFFSDDTNYESQLGRLIETLSELPKTSHPGLVVLVYEYELLKSYGFGLRIFECTNCSIQLQKTSHYFSINNSGFYCDNCLGEMKTNENLIKLSVEGQVIFRSIERKKYKDLSNLDLDSVSIEDLNKILKESISNVLGVQLKTSRFL